ncbi:hypothetical protein CABS01_06675 [Colletotrichum abscissum]|uniref:uncharacterized protein n=1 Tax=Colletotrichum abscissum TaxID=1671311 RepID=UPI0027D4BC9A|nr:uncharacterized protein CABS01_06675 [Colletotrichum abscissum]KAK1514696.1 hypothetical protein CABS01_06675 [Colletotrichum abscissum]
MSSDSGTTPTDIITYIGVPLAVLGVLPILYNTIATLAARSRIRRMLRHARLTALTRSDVVNRVIEVDLPRYAVTPWDRFDHRDEYWSLARHPSSIPGGTWTTFNWRTNTIGLKTQRVEYADQLRQPQVDVTFDELISYLLDLGAVPDAHGWRLLRSTGLWTPVGCTLMQSPDGQHNALTIAPLNDSDGHLSLSVNWSSHWTTRSHESLPPYWVRLVPLPSPAATAIEQDDEKDASDNVNAEQETSSGSIKKKTISPSSSVASISRAAKSNAQNPIACKISSHGLVSAIPEDADHPSTSLYIEHVRIRPGHTAGPWFASAATAYGTSSATILWNYRIPDDVLAFARGSSVPCGVLEVLGVVDGTQTPKWASSHNDTRDNLDLLHRRMRDQMNAIAAEQQMDPVRREQAVRERMRKESDQHMDDVRDRMRLDARRRETRAHEAIQSPKWDAALVATHTLPWLQQQGHLPTDDIITLRSVAAGLLHRMLLDGAFTSALCAVLDAWKAWADNGGMRKSDLEALREGPKALEMFALASVLVAVIRDVGGAAEGSKEEEEEEKEEEKENEENKDAEEAMEEDEEDDNED